MTSKNYSFNELVEMGSITIDTAVELDGTLNYMLPTRENIAAGIYKSVIVKVDICFEETQAIDNTKTEDAASTPVLDHIEIFHELTSRNGNVEVYRFNVYKEYDGVARWVKTMQDYGFTDNLNEIVGTEEEVIIAFGKKSRYAYIKSRSLISLPQTIPADSEDDMPDDPAEASTTKLSKEDRRNLLLEDDEDDEFDDFLDNEDDLLNDED